MERYLSRSSRYIPLMKQIFKKEGLPEDLVYLALIESGFDLRARSRSRAVGPWQFMKPTGKRYGLRIDSWIDERRDPIRATEAAANYLKDLYLMFESWYLAASAYNAGEYKILWAIEDLKTNNYWRISQTKLIRRETKDYIPKLIAAAIIAKNAARYGFGNVDYEEPLEYENTSVDFPIRLREIAKMVDVDEEEICDLNPAFVHAMVPPNGESYEVRIPLGSKELVERALAANRSQLTSNDMVQHTVKAGETLASIARQYHLKARALGDANNLGRRERLTAGLTLVIPQSLTAHFSPVIETPTRTITTVPVTSDGFIIHVVRSGESLWSISEEYDVTVQNLFHWNNLRRSAIHPGNKLRIKAPSGHSKTENTVARSRSKKG